MAKVNSASLSLSSTSKMCFLGVVGTELYFRPRMQNFRPGRKDFERTAGPWLILGAYSGRPFQSEGNRRAGVELAFGPNLPTVAADDSPSGRQADAGAFK